MSAGLASLVVVSAAALARPDPPPLPSYPCYSPGPSNWACSVVTGMPRPNLTRRCPDSDGIACPDDVRTNEAVTSVGPSAPGVWGQQGYVSAWKLCVYDQYRCVADGEQFKCEPYIGYSGNVASYFGDGDFCLGAED